MIELDHIYNMDCLEGMKQIPSKSVDAIICDLPYGTTACKWDTIIPFEPLWEQYKRVIKDRGAIVLFSSQPFTAKLVMSNMKGYKYDWIWNKCSVSNPQLAKVQPLKNYEVISVFGKNAQGVNYYPQGLKRMEETNKRKGSENSSTETLGHIQRRKDYQQEFTNYPQAIISFPCDADRFHPTQKPVNLMRYLIMTYSLMGGGNFGQLYGKRNHCYSLHQGETALYRF